MLSRLAHTTAFRLMAVYVALFVTLAAAIGAALVWQTNELVTRQLVQTLASEADILKTMARVQGPETLAKAVADRSQKSNLQLYFLTDASGRKIAGNLNRWPPELVRGSGGLFRYEAGTETEADHRMAVGVLVTLGGGQKLLVSRDVEDQVGFIERVRTLFLAGFGLLGLVGLVGGILASRLILKRISGITGTAESIMAGDLSRRIAVTGSGDELDDLSRHLNAMLDRIELLMAGLREVSDNVAHDLKTPLTRLRNRAEAALREARSPDDYHASLERTIEEADEIIKTFNAMLLIARLEAGAVEDTLEPFDVAALVRDVVELYEPHAEELARGLHVAADSEVMVKANRQLIGQAVANMVDNALKYGEPSVRDGTAARGADVEVSVGRVGDAVEIAVADSGAGIPEQDRERVLKRFVRLEESRTRPGTGLGLSLVAAVARLHKGSVRIEDNGPGLRVVLTWPLPGVL